MFGPIGFPELMLIFLVVLLLFGPKKLPDFAKFLGKAIREFKKTVNDAKSTIEDELSDTEISNEIKEIDKDLKELKSATQISLDNEDFLSEPQKKAKATRAKRKK